MLTTMNAESRAFRMYLIMTFLFSAPDKTDVCTMTTVKGRL
jgi:hypothetical protein